MALMIRDQKQPAVAGKMPLAPNADSEQGHADDAAKT